MTRISFGIIVLNGEPFLSYLIEALYPFAHQIIFSEGASHNASHACRPDGHSLDGTLEKLMDISKFQDTEKKIIIVTAEDEGHTNGFWPGEKDEQSKAYAKRATGEYLWQVDIDEFYKSEDIQAIIDMLERDPSITSITFPEIPFWGWFDIYCDGPYLRMYYSQFHRLFKWGPGYEMTTHRPPTVIDNLGRDLRKVNWIQSQEMAKKGIFLYHYTQIFPIQVQFKMNYYENLIKNTKGQEIIKNVPGWLKNTYGDLKDPFHVHTVNTQPSWLVKYEGSHPSQIYELLEDIKESKLIVNLRDMSDVYLIINSFRYKAIIFCLKSWTNFVTQPINLCKDLIKKRLTFFEFVIKTIQFITFKKRIF